MSAVGEFTVPVWAPQTGTLLEGIVPVLAPQTGTVLVATVPVLVPQTGTVLRGEYGGRLSKMAGNKKNMSNIAKVKFLFAGNIWEQLIFIPF